MKKFLKFILILLAVITVGGVVYATVKTNADNNTSKKPSLPSIGEVIEKKNFYILEQYNNETNDYYELQLNPYQIGIDEYDPNWYCFYNYDVNYGCAYRIRIDTIKLYANGVSETEKTYSNNNYEWGWSGTGAFFYYIGKSDSHAEVLKLINNEEDKIIKEFSNGLYFLNLEQPTFDDPSNEEKDDRKHPTEFIAGKRYIWESESLDLSYFDDLSTNFINIEIKNINLIEYTELSTTSSTQNYSHLYLDKNSIFCNNLELSEKKNFDPSKPLKIEFDFVSIYGNSKYALEHCYEVETKEIASSFTTYYLQQSTSEDETGINYELALNKYEDTKWFYVDNYTIDYGRAYRVKIETQINYADQTTKTETTYSNNVFEWGNTGTGAFFYWTGEDEVTDINEIGTILQSFNNNFYFITINESELVYHE
ncbi:MAG: hypothetical protein J1F32_01655 [Erysipelotrichales bacterium]|nr:hypothetical protein [Erysipelotrichales bacterium]